MIRYLMVALLLAAGVLAVGCEKPGEVAGLPEGKLVADLKKPVLVPATAQPIKVDDSLKSAAWKDAAALDHFLAEKNKEATPSTRVLLSYDKTNLYVAVINNEPNTAKLTTNVKENGGSVWTDDCDEIYIDSDNSKEGRGGEYYAIFITPKNVSYTRQKAEGWTGKFTSTTKVLPNKAWVLEMAIPWSTIGVTPKAGYKLGLMVARDRFAGQTESNTSYLTWCNDEAKDTSKYATLQLK